MSQPQAVDLTAEQTATLIRSEMARASSAFRVDDVAAGLAYGTCALGLALQLGPSAAQKVLLVLLQEAQGMARRQQGAALSSLGPAMVKLVADVRESGALAPGSAMAAWGQVAEEVGALIGQAGLALAIAPQGRGGLLATARKRAEMLDEVTRGLLGLVDWLDSLELDVT